MSIFVALTGLILGAASFSSIEEQLITSQEVSIGENNSLDGWLDDFSAAKALAEKQNKPLLIAFLGPNWCTPSDELEEEILSRKGFLQSIKNDVVLFKVDIPDDFDDPKLENSQEVLLKKQYKVCECPSLILASSSGEAIAKLEYLPLKKEDFTNYIHEMLSNYQQIAELTKTKEFKNLEADELRNLYTKAGKLADAHFKDAFLKQGLKKDKSTYFLLEKYGKLLAREGKRRKIRKVRNKILARDPKNAKGAQLQLAMMDFEALSHIKKPKHTEDAIKPLTRYLKKFGSSDQKNAWKVEMKISQYLYGQNHVKDALKHAKASIEIAPESARPEIAQSIKYLQTRLSS